MGNIEAAFLEFGLRDQYATRDTSVHRLDPLAQCAVEADDYAWITSALAAIADRHAEGRIVSSLEGGYDMLGLGDSCVAHVGALMA